MSAVIKDRIKEGLLALVRAAVPTVDYFALYRARVVTQSGDGKLLDVQPEDKRLPGMQKVPLKLGVPGLVAKISPGAHVLVGWDGGDPSRPHCICWEGGETVVQLTLTATKIELGGGQTLPMDAVVLGATPCQFTGAPHLVSGQLSKKVFCK